SRFGQASRPTRRARLSEKLAGRLFSHRPGRFCPFKWETAFAMFRPKSTLCAEPAMSVHSTGLSKYELRALQPRRIRHNRATPLDGPPLDPLTVTVAEVHRLTALGLTRICNLIAHN